MFAAFALCAGAKSFTVSDAAGRTYADGDVVNVGYTFNGMGYDWEPGLQVTVNEETSLFGGSSVTVTVSASQPGIVQFCGISGECEILGNAELSRTKTYYQGNTFPLSIEILDNPENLSAEIATTVKITDGSETVTLTVNFLTTEAAGIHEVAFGHRSVEFIGRTMHYALDGTAKFSLYNISGRTVADRTLTGSGSLSFSSLPAGLYIYRLGSETGKTFLK